MYHIEKARCRYVWCTSQAQERGEEYPEAQGTELAQLQRRLEEKEAEVANLTARMVGVNNQAQQVAGQAQQVVGQTQQPTGAPIP